MNAAFQTQRLAEQVAKVEQSVAALEEQLEKDRNVARHLLYLLENLPVTYPEEVQQMRRSNAWLRHEVRFIRQCEVVDVSSTE